MKSELEINTFLDKVKDGHELRRGDTDWEAMQGWLEALEWVLEVDKEILEQKDKEERLKELLLTDKKRNNIIARAIERVRSESESCDDDEDSKSCGVCTCGINCS